MVPAKGSLTAALPGLHLKSDGNGFRAVHQSRELRSQRRFTGSFGTHPRHAKSSHRMRENFAARTRSPWHEVTSHELIKHSQLIATHAKAANFAASGGVFQISLQTKTTKRFFFTHGVWRWR